MFSQQKDKESRIKQHVEKVNKEQDQRAAYSLREVANNLRYQARSISNITGLDTEFRVAHAEDLVAQADDLDAAANDLAPAEGGRRDEGDRKDPFGMVDPYYR